MISLPARRRRYFGLAVALAALALMSAGAVSASAYSYSEPVFAPYWPLVITGGSSAFEMTRGWVRCTSVIGTTDGVTFDEGSLRLTFQGCEQVTAEGRASCSSPEAAAGEVTAEGIGRLVYLSHERKEVGFLLSLRARCKGVSSVEFWGGVLAKLTPVEKPTTDFSLLLKLHKEQQEFTEYELGGGEAGYKVVIARFYGVESGEQSSATLSVKSMALTSSEETWVEL